MTAIDAAVRSRHTVGMSNEFIAIVVVGVAVVGFLWSLHRDMNRLGERVARLEGVVEGLRDAITGRRGAETD